jgi:uncharacterized protein YdiU (UPF0061 family)
MPDIRFDTSYTTLPPRFFARTLPRPVAAPAPIKLNTALAERLGLDAAALASPAGLELLSGNAVPEAAASIATAYAGHQFGNFVPQLGDGRAILLGEVVAPDGARFDIQLKGGGPTPFSRAGDGRAALGPVLREYVVSEAMAALGIPTTRALAAVTTGEFVFREEVLPGAILTRVASSHIRVGTFQFFAAREDMEGVLALANHVIARHYPAALEAENPYRALLEGVVARQARLVAQWLLVGFIHGVMNTDNCSVAGETIDYGPCAFLDDYHPGKVFSSIDRGGRYAYANQPHVLQWNLARLAEALLPLLGGDEESAIASATEALNEFAPVFKDAYFGGLTRKIGLSGTAQTDVELAQDLLARMDAQNADFTNVFRALGAAAADPAADLGVAALFDERAVFAEWAALWRARLAPDAGRQAAMNAVNPAYIPRNHLIEAAIVAAGAGDFAPFHDLLAVLADPFTEQAGRAAFALPPTSDQLVTKTFCGT